MLLKVSFSFAPYYLRESAVALAIPEFQLRQASDRNPKASFQACWSVHENSVLAGAVV
jgi:hypothetical protein